MVQSTARWLLVAILVYAPWAYGSTRLWAMEILNNTLFVCLGIHLIGLVCERRWPRYPWLPLLCLAGLLAETAWMYLNARSYHDSVFWEFVSLTPMAPGLPGSWDREATLFYLGRQLGLAIAFLVAADAMVEPKWKGRFRLAMAITGVSIVIFGLLQRILQAPSIFWLPENTGSTFFGPYRYHGNAGAFLNLIWPVLLLFSIQSFLTSKAYVARAIWSTAFFATLMGCAANISRAAEGITVSLIILAGVWLPWLIRRRRAVPVPIWNTVITVGVIVIFLGALVFGGVASQSEYHWTLLKSQLGNNYQRFLAYQACMRTLPEAGWFGYGAGTFSAIFPDHTAYLGDKIQGYWKYAHEDYLQTVIEYGYVGAAVWGVFLFGSMGRAVVLSFKSSLRTRERLGYAICFLALAGIALHSFVDFPLQIASIELYVMIFIALAWIRPGEDSPMPKE